MRNQLPSNISLPINKLSSIFNNTAASYKFFWFISLLQLFVERQNKVIPIKDILVKMICNAWYPVNYFKINLGYSDKLHLNIKRIREILDISVSCSQKELFNLLIKSENREIIKLISHFEKLVPYRFLSPWIKKSKKTDIITLSQSFHNNCLYRINKLSTDSVEINELWVDYITENYKILLDFSYWNLNLYMQARNPNIPDIAGKLIKPIERNSLTKQRKYWDLVFNEIGESSCIYSGKNINKGNYDVEHFIPWSFVSHNQLWNLIPADSSINSSKSNKLPKLEKYFEPFAQLQYKALKIVYQKQPKNKLLEDYLFLDANIPAIIKLSEKEFKNRLFKTLSPLIQIANNSGFEYWER